MHTTPEDARWRSRCNFSVLQHWSCATIIAQFYCMLHSTGVGKLVSTLWLSWNGVSYMSTWGTDRVASCGVPSNSFILGAGLVFAGLVLFYDLSRIVFTLTAPFMIFVLKFHFIPLLAETPTENCQWLSKCSDRTFVEMTVLHPRTSRCKSFHDISPISCSGFHISPSVLSFFLSTL